MSKSMMRRYYVGECHAEARHFGKLCRLVVKMGEVDLAHDSARLAARAAFVVSGDRYNKAGHEPVQVRW